MEQQYHFKFEQYNSANELNEADAWLLNNAKQTTQLAYAPYSNFFVGAAARLVNGKIVTGTNQENASFPVGICAERVLLSAISSLYPNIPIETIAVSYNNKNGNSNKPISPCGICRQSLLEYESRMNHPIRLLLGGAEGKVYSIPSVKLLLPLSFSDEDIR